MKIAIIRGAFLNPFEYQLYHPLSTRHAVLPIGASWQFTADWFQDYSPRVTPELWGNSLSRCSDGAVVLYNRALSWTTGRSFGFYNLDETVGSVDIVHSAETFFTMSDQAMRWAERLRKPLIVTVSENLPHMGEAHPWRRWRKKKVMTAADRLIAITETTRRMLIEEGAKPEKIDVIPWALDLKRFSPARKDPSLLQRYDLEGGDLVILFVGRFIPEKGIVELVTAIPELLQRYPNRRLRFLFLGKGPLHAYLQAAARQNRPWIRLAEPVTYDQLPLIYSLADVFVLPSKPGFKISEQFGFVLIESMASGVPVVTTRTGSIPDVVGEAAITIEPGSSAALVKGLSLLISSESERRHLSALGLARVREHNDADKNAKRLERLYEDELHHKRGGEM